MTWDALLALDEPPFSFPSNTDELQVAFALGESHALAKPKRGEKWGLVDAGGAFVAPPAFDGGRVSTVGRYAVVVGGKVGFCDETGSIVIPPGYDSADVFSEGLCPVWIQQKPKRAGYKVGFIDERGEMVVAPQFAGALPFREGLAPVLIGKLWGYIDRTGAIAIEPVFTRAWCFHRGVAQVVGSATAPRSPMLREYAKTAGATELRGTWAAIDRTGAIAIPPRYQYSESQFGGMETTVDAAITTGYPSHPAMWRIWGAARFSEGLAAVRVGPDRWGYCDERGDLVVPANWGWARPFTGGTAEVGRIVGVNQVERVTLRRDEI